ncbi:hypothetical protein DENSPDRAFT_661712 [Dentipellis sp. KUC8613]|nr:hypothetical protein DENSPDRAFT_661712 [Dentipellis sp. KUC8613]
MPRPAVCVLRRLVFAPRWVVLRPLRAPSACLVPRPALCTPRPLHAPPYRLASPCAVSRLGRAVSRLGRAVSRLGRAVSRSHRAVSLTATLRACHAPPRRRHWKGTRSAISAPAPPSRAGGTCDWISGLCRPTECPTEEPRALAPPPHILAPPPHILAPPPHILAPPTNAPCALATAPRALATAPCAPPTSHARSRRRTSFAASLAFATTPHILAPPPLALGRHHAPSVMPSRAVACHHRTPSREDATCRAWRLRDAVSRIHDDIEPPTTTP